MKTRYLNSFIPGLVLLAIFSSVPLIVLPQETSTCAVNLQNAQTLFDNGQVEQVPEMLRECLESGFKQEEELAAYKLIIQTYLFQDKNELADSTMLEFLRKNPEYQLSPTDHSSFVHLYNNFEVRPLIQLTFHIGTNIPFLIISESHSASSDTINSTYSINALNLRASLEATFTIIPKLDLNIEAGYSQSSFVKTEEFLDFGTSTYEETLHRLNIPISATYDFVSFGKFTAYARGGMGTSINLASTAKAVFASSSKDIPTQEIDRRDSRIRMDLFCLAGTGIRFKTPGGYLGFEIRSDFGLFNQTVRGGESSVTLVNDYSYVDDDFSLNNLSMTIGYTQIFIKPSKRK
jgi:hypothetical protein